MAASGQESPRDGAPGGSWHARLARRSSRSPATGKERSADSNGFSESAALAGVDDALEQCELCASEILAEHRHLLDISGQRLLCVCRACGVLFDDTTSGGKRYRRIPETVREITDFSLADQLWERLGIPVDLVFCFRSTIAGRTVAFYPGPAGATEAIPQLDAWNEIESLNPVIGAMEADVEALLINRARGVRRYWIVPVDVCYSLVGVMRTRWRGLSGGEEVWIAIAKFFSDLETRAESINRMGQPLPQGTKVHERGDRSPASDHEFETIDGGGTPWQAKTT